ncbi:MAG: GNAT family N-acetyltransferase [Pseudomonadota bacterium]
MTGIEIRGYIPGAIGKITGLHATYYSKYWGFGLFFESKVATGMCEFLNRFKKAHDGFWVAAVQGQIVGSITIDGVKSETDGAHLRWFIVDPACQGQGIGNRLIQEAVDFCKKMRFRRVYLWTFQGLDPARHLYEKHGFRLVKEHEGTQWGLAVKEQMYELTLNYAF